MLLSLMLSFPGVPLWYWVFLTALLGAVVGSFINVYVYRLHTGASINTPSHCLSCGKRLRWYELVPVLSYTLLRGRCRRCAARIPLRDFLFESGLGLLFVMALFVSHDIIGFTILLLLLGIISAIALYDMTHHIIPDELVLALALVWSGWFVVAGPSVTIFITSLTAAVVAGAPLLLLWLLSSGQWIGFGDVKLAAVLGLFLSPLLSVSLVMLSFWVGAAISLLLLLVQYLRWSYATRSLDKKHKSFILKSEVPFAPYIIFAFILVYVWELNVFTIFYNAFPF